MSSQSLLLVQLRVANCLTVEGLCNELLFALLVVLSSAEAKLLTIRDTPRWHLSAAALNSYFQMSAKPICKAFGSDLQLNYRYGSGGYQKYIVRRKADQAPIKFRVSATYTGGLALPRQTTRRGVPANPNDFRNCVTIYRL